MTSFNLQTVIIIATFFTGLVQLGSTSNGFIYGGDYANLGDHPHHVHLQTYYNAHLYVCAGSLIRYNWVLTAGQCVFRFEHIQVFLGLVNREQGPIRHIISVDSDSHVRVHKDYNPPTVLSNDIAMVYLADAKPEWLDHPYVGTVELPNIIAENFVDEIATATGFGLTSDDPNAKISEVLKFVDMPVITNAVCAQTFGNFITDTKLCTNTSTGSTCAGDEGTGLTLEINEVRTVIGIGSFRAADGCTLGHPAVFTRVTDYINWINYNIANPPRDPTPEDSCICDCVCHTCPFENMKEEL